jgi:hypothetical protein
MTTKTKKFSHKGKTLAFCVSYTTFGDQELELPDRFDLLDEAVAAAWVLLNAGSARMVDIPDPKRKGGERRPPPLPDCRSRQATRLCHVVPQSVRTSASVPTGPLPAGDGKAI